MSWIYTHQIGPFAMENKEHPGDRLHLKMVLKSIKPEVPNGWHIQLL